VLHKGENLIGAITRGTIDGGKLAINVAIMLSSFLALVALLDGLFCWVHGGVARFRTALARYSALCTRWFRCGETTWQDWACVRCSRDDGESDFGFDCGDVSGRTDNSSRSCRSRLQPICALINFRRAEI
jgi:hypothetical protein